MYIKLILHKPSQEKRTKGNINGKKKIKQTNQPLDDVLNQLDLEPDLEEAFLPAGSDSEASNPEVSFTTVVMSLALLASRLGSKEDVREPK